MVNVQDDAGKTRPTPIDLDRTAGVCVRGLWAAGSRRALDSSEVQAFTILSPARRTTSATSPRLQESTSYRFMGNNEWPIAIHSLCRRLPKFLSHRRDGSAHIVAHWEISTIRDNRDRPSVPISFAYVLGRMTGTSVIRVCGFLRPD